MNRGIENSLKITSKTLLSKTTFLIFFYSYKNDLCTKNFSSFEAW